MDDKKQLIQVEKTDDRFFDLLVFAFERLDLTPRVAALMVMSDIFKLEIDRETEEVRFYFKTDPIALQQRLDELHRSPVLH